MICMHAHLCHLHAWLGKPLAESWKSFAAENITCYGTLKPSADQPHVETSLRTGTKMLTAIENRTIVQVSNLMGIKRARAPHENHI